jgi:hypothetical protein
MFHRANSAAPARTHGFAARLAVMLASALAGCGATTSSTNIRTAGLVALVDITAERPDQTVVSADMVVGGRNSNTHVVLEGGDQLVASCQGEQREMSSVGNGSYAARFARSAGEFVVALMRGQDAAAPRSVGSLPLPFEITSAFGDNPYSRANDALTITWAPGGTDAEVSIELEGDCIHSAELQPGGDLGTYSIEPGKITAWKSQEKESCNVAVRVVQTRHGQADPALGADSSVVLRQIRATRFVSAP